MTSKPRHSRLPFDVRRQVLEAAGWNPHALVAERLGRLKNVLDVACGTGDFLGSLRVEGERVGLDHDPAAIEAARVRYPTVEWHVAEASCLPLDDRRFKTITFLHALLHVTAPEKALQACRQSMSSGATLWATSNHSSHLSAFWQGLEEATQGVSPEVASLFVPPPPGVPLEIRLERTLREVFGQVHMSKITQTIWLSRVDALRLLESYRQNFLCSEASWQHARTALSAWFARTIQDDQWGVTASLAVAECQ